MMRALKIIMFHILLSCRGIILGASKLFALMFLGTFCLVTCFSDLHGISMAAKIMILIFGMIFTMIFWFYDYLILYLKPKMLDIMLLK